MTDAKQSSLSLRNVQSVVIIELAVLLVMAVTIWRFQPDALMSVLWGGAVSLVPNAYFTFYAFRYGGVKETNFVLLSMIRGQTGKTLLTVAGFALAFHYVQPLVIEYLFGSYILLLLTHIYAAAVISRRCDSAGRQGVS